MGALLYRWQEGERIEICCKATSYLLQQDLKQGQRYFTRVRVILDGDEVKKTMWSEWSPIASWETPGMKWLSVCVIVCDAVCLMSFMLAFLKGVKANDEVSYCIIA